MDVNRRDKPVLSSRQEDYLEAIFNLVEVGKVARSRDIAVRLGVNKSSVTGALRILSSKGLINYSPYGVISLTSTGTDLAAEVVERHGVMRNFLEKILRVGPVEAEEAACRMEHAVSREVMIRFADFIRFFDTCPVGGVSWQEGSGFACRHGASREECRKCERNR